MLEVINLVLVYLSTLVVGVISLIEALLQLCVAGPAALLEYLSIKRRQHYHASNSSR